MYFKLLLISKIKLVMKRNRFFKKTKLEQLEKKGISNGKQNQQKEYQETFLKRNEIKTRQCVYISHRVHSLIVRLVRTLVESGNEVTLGGYIDTVLDEHLNQNKEEINQLYRQERGDLI